MLIRDADYIRQVTSWIENAAGTQSTQETFNEFRRIIECGIVELACKRATEQDIKAIEKTLTEMEENPTDYRGDVAFHDALAVASHNSMLASTIYLINNLIADIRIRFWDLPMYQDDTLASHRAIFEAIKNGDETRAKLEMILHLGIVKKFSDQYPERTNAAADKD